jgi:pyruvate/2-oxoglutarate dehydrogenase complex dihydrolipoamide dehydrogenase (E3) component
LLEPCEKISAGGKPIDLRVYRDRDRIQEIESDVGVSGDLVSVAVREDSGERKIEGSHLLVATGRIANTAGIGLDEAGIAVDTRGFRSMSD